MKSCNKLFLLFAICFVCISLFAQVTAIANSAATIVTPISISKTADMNFGNIAVSTALGTVVLAPAGSRSSTGGVTLPANAGTVTAAAFTVYATSAYTFTITLPSSALIIDDNNGNTMTVSAFTSNPTPTGTLSGGSITLSIGATLNVGGSQSAGTYTSDTPFDVTVNYN